MSDVDHSIELVSKAPKPDPRALNAYRHGITGRVRFYTPDDEVAYTKHCKGYANSWTPVGDFEVDLCQMLADTAWRIKTAGVMENAQQAEVLAHPVIRHCEHDQADIAFEYSRIWKDCGKQLDLLSLYERRLQRNFNETATLLRETQDRRKAEEREQQRLAAQAAAEKAHAEAVTKQRARWEAENPRPLQAPKFDFSKKAVAAMKPSLAAVTPAPTPPRS